MTSEELEKLRKIYKCKDCDYWHSDCDCGHTDENSEICGDFYLYEKIK